MRRLLLILLVLKFVLICALWNVAPATAQIERPLVFVPGILGSRLSDDQGHVVWGNRNSLLNFDQLEIGASRPLRPLKPDGLVQKINMLGPLWTIHQYDSLLDRLHKLGYVEGQNLFVFAYDWRRSNFDAAKDLENFVNSQRALRDVKFDILAHSMGGLVTKVWMLEQGGATRVRKVVYMGTPFQGSMNSFGILSEGWGDFANFVSGGLTTIRRVALSFPSLYELLPTYEKCCRLGSPDQHTFLDVLSPATWETRDWLPPEYRPGAARTAAFQGGLSQARRIGDLMRRQVPNVEQVLFAGDVIETRLYLYVPTDRQSWHNWDFRKSRGDGTVPVWSAVNNFTTLAGSNPSFVEHSTIFTDEWLENKLARELVSNLPPPVRAEEVGEIVTPTGLKRLDRVRADLEPAVVAPGAQASIHLAIEFADEVARGDVKPSAQFLRPGLQPALTELSEMTTSTDLAARRLTFQGLIVAPEEEDIYQIDIDIPGQGKEAIFLAVISNNQRKP